MARIYLSSTYQDLVEYRKAVYQVLRELRHDVLEMEHYTAADERPLRKCLADVGGSDLYVGIFAWRYGFVPDDKERNSRDESITALEYHHAREKGIATLLFLLNEDTPWPPKFHDAYTEPDHGERIKAFRNEVKREHVVSFFSTPDELARKVATAVSQWEKENTPTKIVAPLDTRHDEDTSDDSSTWGIVAPGAGKSPYVGEGITVAILSTGVDIHPELKELDRIIQDTFRIDDKIVYGPELVRIPAGKYSIGREEDETKFQVINEFAIGQFPVTFYQYDLFCEVSGNEKPNDMGWGRKNRPVINVSFFDAKKYIEWLCQRTGKEYRLPTAVEWEYAARAGTDSAYWWGNEIRRNDEIMANCNGCGGKWDKKRRTSPVGSFAPNDWKLHDTTGNAWEWTYTVYAYNYKRDDRTEGEVPVDKSSRVIIKGGSWYDKPDRLHWSIMEPFWVDEKSDSIGFRVARSLPSLV